jgi:hypothetical protein
MKYFIFLLLCMTTALNSQTTEYVIEQANGKFFYSVVTTSLNGRQITTQTRVLQNEAELKQHVYSQAEIILRDQSRYYSLIEELDTKREAIYEAMRNIGFNDFEDVQTDKYASQFVGEWEITVRRVQQSNLTYKLIFEPEQTAPYLFKLNGNNKRPFASAKFENANLFTIKLEKAFEQITDVPIKFSSRNGRIFFATDDLGNKYKLERK